MPRGNAKHPLAVRIDEALYQKLDEFVRESGQNKTAAIERALQAYIDDYFDKRQKLATMRTEEE